MRCRAHDRQLEHGSFLQGFRDVCVDLFSLLSQGPHEPAKVYTKANGSKEGPDAAQQSAYFTEMGIPSQLP